MRGDFERRRQAWALALSLLLHLGLFGYVALKAAPPRPAPSPHQAIELTIIEVPPQPEKPAPRVEVAPSNPTPPPRPEKKSPAPAAPPRPDATAERPAAAVASTPPGGAPAAPTGPPDMPKSVTLVPRSDFAVKGTGLEPEGPRGHTLRNDPSEQPDAVAMNEYTQEKLGRRTGQMVEGMVADQQAKNGMVDPYFTAARRAMEGDLSAGAVPGKKDFVREGLKGYLAAQERYGKTGNPLGVGNHFAEQNENLSLARTQNSGPNFQASDTHAAGEVAKAQQSMAAMDSTSRSLDHALLVAVLEITQEPGGGIADAHIVKTSGDKAFDEHVLHRARKVFLTLEDPPQEGFGISSAGWRTLWRFSYFPPSAAELRGQRVRVELIRVEKGTGSGNPLEHATP